MNLVRAPDGGGAGLGQAQVAHLSGAHQFGHGAHRFLDRHIRVDPVQVIEIDLLDAQALERGVARLAQRFRPAVDPAGPGVLALASVNPNLVASSTDRAGPSRLSDLQFGIAVDIGGIENVTPRSMRDG